MQLVAKNRGIKYPLSRPDEIPFPIHNHKASQADESPFFLNSFSLFLLLLFSVFFHCILSVGFSSFDTLSFPHQAQKAFDHGKQASLSQSFIYEPVSFETNSPLFSTPNTKTMPRPAHGAVGLAFIGTRVLQTVCLLVSMSLVAKFIEAMVDDQQAPPAPLVGVLCVVCFAILYCATTLLLYWDHQLPLLPTAGLDGLFFLALMISSIIIGKPLSYLSCKAASGGAKELVENVGQNLGKNPTSTAVAAATAAAVTTAPTVAAYTATTPTTTYASTVYTTTTVANAAVTVAATLSPGSSTKVVGSDGNTYTISGRLLKRVEEVTTMDYANWIQGGTPSDCTMMKAVWGFGIALTILFVFSAVMVLFIWKAGRAKSAPKQVAEGA
jgi:hypothetical protein